MRQHKEEDWARWRGLVSEQVESERGLRGWQLYEWKKRLRDPEAAPFVAVEVARSEAPTRPVTSADVWDRDPSSPGLEFGSGTRLQCKSLASFAVCSGVGVVIGLPSLQALDGAPGPRIWLAAEATDMRCGFDRVARRVQTMIGEDPLSGHLFLFRSRNGNRLKILA
jgi:hypothetical protein